MLMSGVDVAVSFVRTAVESTDSGTIIKSAASAAACISASSVSSRIMVTWCPRSRRRWSSSERSSRLVHLV